MNSNSARLEWDEVRARLRRSAALRGPLAGRGPFVRLTLAWIRGDRQAALACAQAIDDELGWVGYRLNGEPEEGQS